MSDDTPNGSPSDSRFESVLAEIQQAREQGQATDVQHYLDCFPDLAERLRDYFQDLEWFRGVVTPPQAPAARHPEASLPHPGLPPGSLFAGYEIIKELGRGGMGIVYYARQLSPEREVALKVIRTDRLAELPDDQQRQWLERFRREAQLVASLEQHPNLVTLYEVGEHEGRPFFTMQLVRGGSLAETVRGGQWAAAAKGAASWSAQLVAVAARALNHVHQRGVLHRDLKPANILLDGDGQPLVSDFGLARRLDQSGSLVAGAIEGTAEYMAPEQARGLPGAVTTAADVYSLGAVLYALLTGRPPFKGTSTFETLMLVIEQQPAPPQSLNPRVPRDLQTICLKCLEKETGRRYASAAALAEDLECWLADRPLIHARPTGMAERLWRWCRRNPVPAVAAAVVLAVAVAAFALITDSRNKALTLADQNARLADDYKKVAADNGDLATTNGKLVKEKEAEAGRATKEATRAQEKGKEAQREAIRLAFQQATTLSDQGEVGGAMHMLAYGLGLAEQAGEADLERLFRTNLAAWRYHLHTQRRVLPHPAGVSAVAWSPDGRTLATACWDWTTRLWDTASGKARGEPVKHGQWITGLIFGPDGRILLTIGHSKVGVWDVGTGRRLAELDHGRAIVTSAALAPDGHTVLTGSTDGKVQLWDTSGKRSDEPLSLQAWVEAVAFAPDGRSFATGDKAGHIIVWDAASRKQLVSLEHPGGVMALAFGAEWRLLSGGEDRTARLWNLASPWSEPVVLAHQAPVKTVALSPDGSLALTGSLDRTARVWDAATGKAMGQPLVQPGEVLAVAFGPDGRKVATGSGREHGDARVWDVSVGNPLGGPLTHTSSILAVAVSPDGKRVATAGRDNVARLWDAHTGEPIGNALPHNAEVNAVAFSPDSQTLVSAGDDSFALFWHAATGKPVVHESGFEIKPGLRMKQQFGVSPDNVKGIPSPGGIRDETEPFWGPARGKSSGWREGNGAGVFALAFSPDGKKLAMAGRWARPILCNARPGAAAPRMHLEERSSGLPTFSLPRRADLYAVAFSPDGRLIALGGRDGEVRLWDAAKTFDEEAFAAKWKTAKPEERGRLSDEATATRLVAGPLKHGGQVVALAFSPDGRTLLTGCSDGTGCLWDVATGELRLPLRHQGAVVAVAFSPDGQTFVTGSWDGAARVWKTANGEAACPPLAHQGKVLAVAFSPDGHAVLTGSEDWTARLWDTATGQPIGPPLRHQDQVRSVAFRPDGRAVITAGDDRQGLLWPVPAAAEGVADRIRDWVEARTGTRRLADGSIQLLAVAEWETAVARLGDWEPVAPEDHMGWDRQQARVDETRGRWQAARWHLDRLIAADPKAGALYLRRGKAALPMRDPTAARRDFDQAAARLPAEWEPWYQRGLLAIRENRWQEGIDDMDKALERRKAFDEVALRGPPAVGTAAILIGRGYARAALGQWKEAADDLKVVGNPFEPSSPSDWAAYALVLLKNGDIRGYGDACQQMLRQFTKPEDEPRSTIVTTEFGRREVHRFGKPFDPEGAATMAWVCCLSPNAPPDFPKALGLAKKAAEAASESYPSARAYGATLCRAEEYEAAVKQLEAAAALRKQPSPSVWLLLAMAHQRCQRKDQAKEWLSKARDWIAKARDAKPGGEAQDVLTWHRLAWPERLALELLEREAGQLIEGESSRK
jgi:WD40 repeat protein/tetratricopeptide (TPR) repeat protein/tRNA A-37 threonylcarbamoyl transferase component Bud32